jgi:hypothetical protein
MKNNRIKELFLCIYKVQLARFLSGRKKRGELHENLSSTLEEYGEEEADAFEKMPNL